MVLLGSSAPVAHSNGRPSSSWVLQAQEDSTNFNAANWYIYDEGHATEYTANSWMAVDFQVNSGLIRFKSEKLGDGTRRGAAAAWIGPGGVAQAKSASGCKWEVRFRSSPVQLGYGFVVMLWPNTDDDWPTHGEFDIYERFPGSTDFTDGEVNLHYSTTPNDGSALNLPYGSNAVDWTSFHTVGVEWYDGVSVEVFVDGNSIGKTTSPTWVPSLANSRPMGLIMQTEFYTVDDGDAGPGPVYNDVQWVKFYTHI